MALAVTLKASGVVDENTSGTAANEALGAITFAADSHVLVCLGAVKASAIQAYTEFTAAASGLTFTEVTGAGVATSDRAAMRFVAAPHAAGGSTVITIATNATGAYGLYYAIWEITGHDTGDPFGGVIAAVQTAVLDNSYSITLDATPATDSIVIAAFTADTNVGANTVDPGTGWSEDSDVDSSGSNFGVMETQRRTGSTSTTVTWNDIRAGASVALFSTAAAAVEVKQAAGGAAAELGGPWFVSPFAELPFSGEWAPFEVSQWQPPIPLQVWANPPELAGDQSISLADTASAADGLTVAAGVPLADTAVAADALSTAAALPLADAAAAADALSTATALTLADTATATDALTISAQVTLADTAAAAETLAAGVPISLADTAVAADSLTSTAALTLSDTASAADALSTAAALPLADTAAAADSLSISAPAVVDAYQAPRPIAGMFVNPNAASIQLTGSQTTSGDQLIGLSDTASASDSLSISVTLTLADTATAAEFMAAGVPITLADTASASDALSSTVTLPLADTATATDALTANAALALADTAATVELLAAGVPKTLSDTAAAADTLGVTVAVLLADTATATDLLASPSFPVTGPVEESRISTGTDARRVGTGTETVRSETGTDARRGRTGSDPRRVSTGNDMFRITTDLE